MTFSLFLLGPLVLIHELGHLAAARLLGVGRDAHLGLSWIRVRTVRVWPYPVARLRADEVARAPGRACLVALAGPAASILTGSVLLIHIHAAGPWAPCAAVSLLLGLAELAPLHRRSDGRRALAAVVRFAA